MPCTECVVDIKRLRMRLDKLLRKSATDMTAVAREAQDFLDELRELPPEVREGQDVQDTLMRGPQGAVELRRRLSAYLLKTGRLR